MNCSSGELVRGALDHDHVRRIADIDEIEIALGHLGMRRIGDELAAHAGDAHGADRPAKGMSLTMSAALAPLMKRMSGSITPSALRRTPMICVS